MKVHSRITKPIQAENRIRIPNMAMRLIRILKNVKPDPYLFRGQPRNRMAGNLPSRYVWLVQGEFWPVPPKKNFKCIKWRELGTGYL